LVSYGAVLVVILVPVIIDTEIFVVVLFFQVKPKNVLAGNALDLVPRQHSYFRNPRNHAGRLMAVLVVHGAVLVIRWRH